MLRKKPGGKFQNRFQLWQDTGKTSWISQWPCNALVRLAISCGGWQPGNLWAIIKLKHQPSLHQPRQCSGPKTSSIFNVTKVDGNQLGIPENLVLEVGTPPFKQWWFLFDDKNPPTKINYGGSETNLYQEWWQRTSRAVVFFVGMLSNMKNKHVAFNVASTTTKRNGRVPPKIHDGKTWKDTPKKLTWNLKMEQFGSNANKRRH